MGGLLMGRLVDAVAALVAIGAGIYLLSRVSTDASVGQSWLEVIAHGTGAFFVAAGVAMFRAAEQRRDQIRAIEKAAQTSLSVREVAPASTAPEGHL